MFLGTPSAKFWLPFAVYCALTPVFLFLGVVSAGAGHGNYFFAKLFFPFTMFSTAFYQSITGPFIILAVVQYPAYGLLSGLSSRQGRLRLMSVILLAIHALVAVLCLVVPNQNF